MKDYNEILDEICVEQKWVNTEAAYKTLNFSDWRKICEEAGKKYKDQFIPKTTKSKKLVVMDNSDMTVHVYPFEEPEGDITDAVNEVLDKNNHNNSECSWMSVNKFIYVEYIK